jgi:hypothetical protein
MSLWKTDFDIFKTLTGVDVQNESSTILINLSKNKWKEKNQNLIIEMHINTSISQTAAEFALFLAKTPVEFSCI